MKDCYIDMNMPERLSDYAYFIHRGSIERRYVHESEGKIIPAVAIESYGVYEQYFGNCRSDPEVGLEILRRGLAVAKRKAPIAQDMGYILCDERRVQEAIEAFTIAIDEGPSSYFIFLERAALYDQLQDYAKSRADRQAADEWSR